MSEKKAAEKKPIGKPSFFARLKNGLKALPVRIATAFKNMAAELKKVSWPSRKDLINYSVVVVVFLVVMAVVVGLLDMGSSALIRQLVKL